MKRLRNYKIVVCFLLLGGASVLTSRAETGNGKELGTVLAKANTEQQEAVEVKEQDKLLPGVNLQFSGFVRLLGFYRNMGEHYQVDEVQRGMTLPITIGLNDGTAQPNLMFKVEGQLSSKTYIQLHQSFVNYLGINNPDNESIIYGKDGSGRLASIFGDGFYFQGNRQTKFGSFELKAGSGAMYKNLSPMTLWTFQYRDDMFERYPWDPAGSNWRRYESYYNVGDVPRDRRWGRRGIQGVILDGFNLPGGTDFSVVYGKNQNSGGFDNWSTNIPQNMFAGRVSKNVGLHKFGFNWHSQFGYDTTLFVVDTITFNDEKYTVNTNKTTQVNYTLDALLDTKHVRFYTEFGMGAYASRYYFHEDTLSNPSKDKVNEYKKPWSSMFYAEADVKKSWFGFPFKVSAFRIGQHAINNSSAMQNSSIEEAMTGKDYAQFAARDQTLYFEGMLTEIGQITNNRQGFDFKTKRGFKNLIVELSFGMQQELVNIGKDTIPPGYHHDRGGVDLDGPEDGTETGTFGGVNNSVSFYHIVNQFQRGRFYFNRRYQGPYNRIQADFRRTWENIAITDTVVDYKKSFNMLDLALKYKMQVAKRPLILSGFYRANSVQDAFSVIPVFSDDAFIRQQYYELMGFYQLNNKWSLIAFYSTENARGNTRTELADDNGELITNSNGKPVYDSNGKPIDQVGVGYGIGFDYDFTKRASLDVRYRWYTHEDRNFTKDKFDGQDMTIELKVFF